MKVIAQRFLIQISHSAPSGTSKGQLHEHPHSRILVGLLIYANLAFTLAFNDFQKILNRKFKKLGSHNIFTN